MYKEDIGITTKPQIVDNIIVTENDNFEGYQITEFKRLVWGSALKNYENQNNSNDARANAYNVMLDEAQKVGANAIIGARFEVNNLSPSVDEVLAVGNAVKIEPIINYSPKGSVEFLLAKFVEFYTRDSVKYGNDLHAMRFSQVNYEQKQKVVASPVAKIVKGEITSYALCPACSMKYRVGKDADGNVEVMGHKDVDPLEDGLQIYCIRCGKKFTIPEDI